MPKAIEVVSNNTRPEGEGDRSSAKVFVAPSVTVKNRANFEKVRSQDIFFLHRLAAYLRQQIGLNIVPRPNRARGCSLLCLILEYHRFPIMGDFFQRSGFLGIYRKERDKSAETNNHQGEGEDTLKCFAATTFLTNRDQRQH